MTERTARLGLFTLLALYLAVGLIYSVVAPLGESPDEMEQFWYLRHIVQTGRLPRTAEDRVAAGGKSHEPPLYYALLGLATSWVEAQPLERLKMIDPDRFPRHSLPDEVLINFAPLHTADEEWPYRGLVLVWHLARVLSLGLMAGALAVGYRTIREMAPEAPGVALLATTAATLTPQFLYIGGSLNNDALTALLGATLLWLLVRVARRGPSWGHFFGIGAVLGLARLTKFYTAALVPVAALALLWLACRRRDGRYAAGALLAVALALAIPAPWMLYIQPVDPGLIEGPRRALALLDVVHVERWFSAGGEGLAGTGLGAVGRALAGALGARPLEWALTLFRSYWGTFGPMTVAAPGVVYATGAALTALSAVGWARLAVAAARGRPRPLPGAPTLGIALLLALGVLATEAVFYGVMRRLPDTAQARHLYPAITSLGLLMALGWWGLSPRLARAPAIGALAAVLLGLSAASLPTIYRSVERPFLPVRSTPWPDAPAPGASGALDVRLGDGVVLEGARLAGSTDRVHGALFWRADAPPEGELVAVLELVDGEGAVRAVWAGHPGGARYPTQAWSAGDRVRQTLEWPLPPLAAGRYDVRLRALREGAPAGQVPVASVELPATAQGTRAVGGVSMSVDGAAGAEAGLRDSVLVTRTGGGLGGLRGPGGYAWLPLGRTDGGEQMAFVVDARMPPGVYTLAIPPARSPSVTVVGRSRSFEVPEGLVPLGAVLDGAVELAGYRIEDAATPGGVLDIHLAWRALRRPTTHHTVFTHLVDGEGRLWGQHDKLPGQDYSTLFWAPGEVVADAYRIAVDPAAPQGTYSVRVGMYQALTGERAAVTSADGAPLGDSIVVGDIYIAPR